MAIKIDDAETFSRPGDPIGLTLGPLWVLRLCPFTRQEGYVVLLETLVCE